MSEAMVDFYGCAALGGDGWRRAGFDVVIVDNDRNALRHARLAGHETVEGDALKLLADRGFMRQFDAAAASPPCQGSSATRELAKAQARAAGRPLGQGRAVALIEPTVALLTAWGGPWIVENVTRSVVRHMPGAVRLCGSSWGLKVERHRWFAPSPGLTLTGSRCDHSVFDLDERTGKPRPWGVYGSMRDNIPSGGRTVRSVEHGHDVMGISYRRLPWTYLCEGLPPVFTEYLGRQLLTQLQERAA